MKTKLYKLATCALLLAPASALADNLPSYDFCIGNVYYTITTADGSNVNTVEVACGNKNLRQSAPLNVMQKDILIPDTDSWEGNAYSGDVVVPETVTYNNTEYKVTGIGLGAFVNSENLTSISLPSSITYIGKDAFMGCKSLTEFTVPEAVNYIQNFTFAKCDNLSKVDLSNAVYSIGDSSFLMTPSDSASPLRLTGLDNLMATDYAAFYQSNIEEISLPECFESWNYSFAESKLIKIKISAKITDFAWSLLGCSNLEEIDLPDGQLALSYSEVEDAVNLKLIRERSLTPPTLNFNWAAHVTTDCVLEVPAQSVELYSAADNWKEFTTIRAIDETGIKSSLSESTAKVVSGKGIVSLSDCEGATASIASIDGKTMWSTSKAAAAQTVSLPQGIYIVRLGTLTTKVIVK